MKVQNLEQSRAAHAISKCASIRGGKGDGDATGVVKKIPAQVISCGLLASMAFAKEKGEGYADVFNVFIDYCSSCEPSFALKSKNIDEAISEISRMDSCQLRYVTSEFMKYLSYLRRFVQKKQ
jgi:CRISPR/Cas system CMR-associated protein Cmr5 small subunit